MAKTYDQTLKEAFMEGYRLGYYQQGPAIPEESFYDWRARLPETGNTEEDG